ncbi:hypothetical protein EVJ27_11560 [Exiguobacterium sp. SH3S2]|uniref:hypothetical protein n=1 Tax=unclassified Exiguobacterium TaxID=2644629 RepID=UPI00103A56A7|nr:MULTISPECIES: hypothetical protein [unclassified Exiguobacterium]TCI42876.1 hypothetical protein EVJ28_11580 [Exiguobacterium sp. SH3S3]TCI58629.1 hypothetical protein EVJ27_11560 [Exiguobacterium sp. SH3S2]
MVIWPHVISMPIYFALLLGVIVFFRKHYKLSAYFWLASLLTFPLWLMGNVDGWFRWVKILSVIIPTIIVGFSRIAVQEDKKGLIWDFLKKDDFLWFFYAILFLNIAEATIKDITLENYFNAACGFLLCVTIPFAPKYWKILKNSSADLVAYTTGSWNFIYTSWNACFVYAESPMYFASSLCILLAAELYPVMKKRPELYITARIYTLAAHLLLRACFDVFPKVMDSTSWFNPQVLSVWGIINFVIIVPYVFWHMWQLHNNKAQYSFKRLKSA